MTCRAGVRDARESSAGSASRRCWCIALLVLLVAGVGYGAYTFLPTATITITPSTTELRPSPFAVTADPHVAVIDVPAGVVPAELVELPLHVSGTFPATGIEARETRATGQVRFRSENTLDQVAVADGTVVATADGVEFVTTQAATVPRADFATSTPGHGRRSGSRRRRRTERQRAARARSRSCPVRLPPS